MHAATDRLEFAPPPTPGLLRSLALAVLAHAFLLAALTWGVHWKSDAVSVSFDAELWSAVPQAAAPKLVEAPPEPVLTPITPKAPLVAPAPKPPPPVQTPTPEAQPKLPDPAIALERDKLRQKKALDLKKQQELDKQRLEKQRLEQLKQEELKQKKLQLDKQRLQDQRDAEKKAAQDKKKAAQEAQRKEASQAQEDAKMLAAQRKANIERMTGLAGASGGATARGTQLQSSGPSSSYAGRIRARIKPNIVFVDDIAGNPAAEVEVRTASDGTIISSKLTKPSGVKAWDDAVLRAIEKTEVLPRDVDGRVISPLTISFTPKD
ncbi:MAG: cell envelope integrity protein TolA [Gammaproteobacteria bacterium]|uniref:cell envelope integrity protein TolA n=1 Tax=Rhodoferax sp. TaxID=50421 RepID=UPI001827710C|nr:cell envelope integrity protein TolA [Rhodoferax sp.]MBU3899137.1 cell envelope integrity protein TolA [Gammaproteobacteria bacterium]MBA3059986.1 cell envelope integrity protein TolA [Rhodoferax sp.]MBU3996636.1 cell envelope integrity protein TolA [Gammaproteobacteria bacterium]MBU4018582.1 cell envelope integrity protein TolA [Gammaproteobacteria bacterium]MBU4080594.1 cell envelope integrity protein TolA [Gammaproteobacteria bacterium]